MKIIFFGTADFGIPSLELMIQKGYDIPLVVTVPPKPKGRGLKLSLSPVQKFAEDKGLKVVHPESLADSEFIDLLNSLNADLFIVIAFRILPPEIFNIPRLGTINAHASLLPKFRGPAPIQRAIEAGEIETGVTIFRIDEKIDTGNVVLQQKLDIPDSETTEVLYDRLSKLAAGSIEKACEMLSSGNVKFMPQNHEQATKAPKLKKSEGKIDWTLSARTIYNKIRAFKPFPGTYFFLNKKRVILESGTVVEWCGNTEPGTIVDVDKKTFTVMTGDGAVKVTNVKPEGKGAMPVSSFKNGTPIKKGMQLN